MFINQNFHIFLLQIARNMSMDEIDIREFLLEMRQYRMGLIQTHDQLRFSYLAIIEAGREILGQSVESTFKTVSEYYFFDKDQVILITGTILQN